MGTDAIREKHGYQMRPTTSCKTNALQNCGDDTQRRHIQARVKRMARHDKDVFIDEVASEAKADARRGKIGSVF